VLQIVLKLRQEDIFRIDTKHSANIQMEIVVSSCAPHRANIEIDKDVVDQKTSDTYLEWWSRTYGKLLSR
jgi:ornithine carbamoyltransferase